MMINRNFLATVSLALRPWSLPASVSPVLLGAAMAFGDGYRSFLTAGLALCTAILIHLGTNVVNDIGDFDRGADAANPGATFNVILEGVVPRKRMVQTAATLFALGAAFGLAAVAVQGAWILIIPGALSILAGIHYTAGPRPAAYSGWGESLVIVFFGPVAAGGTYYLQAGMLTWPVILAGTACGLICSGILIVNNYRDYDGDKRIGKKTLAVRLGRRFAQWEYAGVLCTAAGIPLIIAVLSLKPGVLISLAAFAQAVPPARTVFTTRDIPRLNAALAATGQLLLTFSILFSIGWLL